MAGFALPAVEIAIALSVIGLGAAVVVNVRAPVAVARGVVGLFAVFHGFAHDAEMPEYAAGLSYAAVVLIATAGMHAVGLGLRALAGKAGSATGIAPGRVTGDLAAVAGLSLLSGLTRKI